MTYRNCRKLIEVVERKGIKTADWIADMGEKMDIFLLNDRITEVEYTELIGILGSVEPSKAEGN